MDAFQGLSDRPLVTCVVPAFNAEMYLEEALSSIEAQTHRPLEIVLVDDGSMDGTADLAERHASLVRVVRQTTAGPAAARNRGIRESRGEFVAFLDPDDLWEPGKLARQLQRFVERPELQCSVTYARAFWDEDSSREASYYDGHPRLGPVPGYATTTLLARREDLRHGRASRRVALVHGCGRLVPSRPRARRCHRDAAGGSRALHRLHASNLTRRAPDASENEFLDLVKGHLDRSRAAGRS